MSCRGGYHYPLGYIDFLEGEPFLDLNGNGVWDQGDFLHDRNGNGILDADRRDIVNDRDFEPYIDGDSIIGEPFNDVNGDGIAGSLCCCKYCNRMFRVSIRTSICSVP